MDKSLVAKEFGKELKRLREEYGFSQEGLALEANVDRSFLSKMERGIRQPSITILFKLCDALEYPADKLVKNVRDKL
jgi:transcriptional regulator with XRE-family HTH domain